MPVLWAWREFWTEQGIKTLDDLADLAGDELLEYLPDSGMYEEEANAVIMAARAHWFEDEEDEAGESGEAAEAGADGDPAPAANPDQ